MIYEEQWEDLHQRKEQIAQQVHELLDKETADLPSELDEALRQQLTESFRFWRRTQ